METVAQTVVGRAYSKKFWWQTQVDITPQDEVKEVVAYAKAKFANVIPEIEMPGSTLLCIKVAYPEFAVILIKFNKLPPTGCIWRCTLSKRRNIPVLEKCSLTEVMELFPSEYIHIGGDECPKTMERKSFLPRNYQAWKT